MSLTESIHHYNVGTLITVPTEKLKVALTVLENNIGYMSQVAKQQSVCQEVYADLRKYELVRSEIARLIENRIMSVNASLTHSGSAVLGFALQ
jgi:hypothetical protein